MPGCIVPGCSNRTSNKNRDQLDRESYGLKITFHRFPQDEERRQQWKVAINRKDWEPKRTSEVCSAHFAKEDFDLTSLSIIRLRDTAVPSIFKNTKVIMLDSENSNESVRLTRSNSKEQSGRHVSDALRKMNITESENSNESSEIEMRLTRSSEKTRNSFDAVKKLTLNTKKFMENFNPETSARENRKLTRKLNATGKRNRGTIYDERGIHISSGRDICDCLTPNCSGCFYPCPKCNSTKCGPDCRINRKFSYEQADFEGTNKSLKFADVLK